jgi:hypothetical protein
MNAQIINFEMLHAGEDYRRSSIIKQLELAKEQGIDIVYGLMLIDGFLYRSPETFPVDIDVKLIAGMCEHPDHLYFNFYHRIVYNSFKHVQLPKWNSEAKSFLFLGGVPSRLNRINLLSKFYDKKMLDNAVWTFFPPWDIEMEKWCRHSLSHYTDQQYLKFLEEGANRIDDIYEISKNYSRASREEWDNEDYGSLPWMKDLAWIDPQVFADTVLSVISEGNAYPPATNFNFLTEKTWRTIAMRHPFVFAGYPEQFDYAKSLGLKTFEEYMLIKDYAHIQDENLRLDAVVENVNYFLDSYEQHKEYIRADTEHNYKVFKDITDQEDKFLDSLAVTAHDKNKWFEQTGLSHLMKIQDENINA